MSSFRHFQLISKPQSIYQASIQFASGPRERGKYMRDEYRDPAFKKHKVNDMTKLQNLTYTQELAWQFIIKYKVG